MTILLPVGLAIVGAVVLGVSTLAGGWIVTAAVGLCVVALATGWPILLRLPHRAGSSLLVGGLGVAALVVASPGVALSDRQRPLAAFAAVAAFAVLAAFAHELLRRDGRHDAVDSLIGTLAGETVAMLAAGWVLLAQSTAGASAVVVAVSALVASRATSPVPGPPGVWLGLGAGPAAALGAAFAVPDVSPLTAIGIGLAVAGVGSAVDRVVTPLVGGPSDLGVLAQAAAPVAVAGTLAYAVVRVAGG